MNNLEKIKQAYEFDKKTNLRFPSNNWVISRITLEILALVNNFDFSESEEEEDSIFIDNICFYLKNHWINPGETQLWAAYFVRPTLGKVFEKNTRIRCVEDLVKVYEERFIEK